MFVVTVPLCSITVHIKALNTFSTFGSVADYLPSVKTITFGPRILLHDGEITYPQLMLMINRTSSSSQIYFTESITSISLIYIIHNQDSNGNGISHFSWSCNILWPLALSLLAIVCCLVSSCSCFNCFSRCMANCISPISCITLVWAQRETKSKSVKKLMENGVWWIMIYCKLREKKSVCMRVIKSHSLLPHAEPWPSSSGQFWEE